MCLRGSKLNNPNGPATLSRNLEMEGPKAKGDGTLTASTGLHFNQMPVAVTDEFEHQRA